MEATTKEMQELLDREAIRNLPVAYCHYVWTHNHTAIAALFAPDGRFELPEHLGYGPGASGTEELLAFYAAAGPDSGMSPYIHNVFIEILSENHAKAAAYGEFRNRHENFRLTHVGIYEDTYTKIDGEWKFQTRKVDMIPITHNDS